MRVGRLPSWQVEIIPDSEDERKRYVLLDYAVRGKTYPHCLFAP